MHEAESYKYFSRFLCSLTLYMYNGVSLHAVWITACISMCWCVLHCAVLYSGEDTAYLSGLGQRQ